MNPPNKSKPVTAGISAEALIGIGITIAALGLLGLLLGTAEHFRSVPATATIWFAIGAVMVVFGIVVAVLGRARHRR
jgi:hypothetical protein